MKCKITFEYSDRYFGYGADPSLKVRMRFEECSYDEFHLWLDENSSRLMGKSYDIGHSDKVIYFR